MSEHDEGEGVPEASSEVRRPKTIRFEDEGGVERVEEEEEDTVAPGEETGPQVDEIQRKMLMMAGQDVDQYMKEVRGKPLKVS